MRILFTTVAALGNFHPLIPLARAFQSQGHDVAFATATRFGPVVEAAGFEAIPAGLNILYNEYVQQLPPGSIGPARFAEIFVDELAGPMLTDLLRIIPAWHPDLIVHDVVEFGGLTAGEILKIPHVVHNLILFGYSPDLLDFLVRREYAAFREAHGLPPDPRYDEYFRYLYLQHVPESIAPLSANIAARSHLIRPAFPEAQAGAFPAWMKRLPELPTVYVTLGTVYNHTPGLLEGILAALGDGQYNVIVTVGADRDPAELGSQPACVHVERYLPQAVILPLCNVMVCHGGSGTLVGALAAGLPMLIIPCGRQQIRAWLEGLLQNFHVTSRNHQVSGERVVWDATVSADILRHMGFASGEGTVEAVVHEGTITSFALTTSLDSPGTSAA